MVSPTGAAFRLVAAVALAVVPTGIIGITLQSAQAATPVAVPAFSATASASGVRVTLDDPGAPLSDELVDVGGPTAQSALASLGTSTAYAALPDPGSLVNSAPGLVVGLVSQGAYGLPPVTLPNLPPLPLQVSSDASGTPKATFGAGPYELTAASTDTSSIADANGGLTTSGTSVASLTAHAGITENKDGGVTATATSEVNGLVVGPLTLGSIVSTSTETIAPDGTITPSSSTKIIGASIGGLEISIDKGGLTIGGVVVPLNALSDRLFAGATGYSLSFQDVTSSAGTVVAPNIVIQTPFSGTTSPGYIRLTIGGSNVTMSGSAALPGSGTPTVGSTSALGGGSVGAPVGVGAPGVIAPGGPTPSVPPATSPSAPSTGNSQPSAPTPAAEAIPLVGVFSIRSLYLVVAGLALGVFVLSHLIRLLGVRV